MFFQLNYLGLSKLSSVKPGSLLVAQGSGIVFSLVYLNPNANFLPLFDLLFHMPTVELSRETSPAEDGVPMAEEATEATEANAGVGEEGEEDQGVDQNQPGIYTEHVFTDPLGVGPTDSSQADKQR